MAMKLGTENKRTVAIAAVLGIVVIGLLIYELSGFFSGPSTPPPAAVATAPVVRTVPSPTGEVSTAPSAQRVAGGNLAALDPTLHPEIMAEAENLDYTGAGRNIFSLNSAPPHIETVRGPVRPSAAVQAAAAPAGPPPPPPIELKFFGYEAQGDARKAFLLHGDDVFIASEGDVVDRRYKVVKIAPFSIQITDLLYNNTQSLPLVQS